MAWDEMASPALFGVVGDALPTHTLHSHMLEETPLRFFMHFWANDDAVTLARGLRAALDRTNVRRPVTT